MRMIDADALKTKMLDYYSYSWQLREEIGDFFDNAPTIVEFDGEVTKVVVKGEEYFKRTQWIPCSERLPDEETDVIVTRTFLGCKDCSRGWNNHIPPKTYVEVAQYFNGEWTALSDEYKVARNRHTDPIAWMPLPEPYGGDSDDT